MRICLKFDLVLEMFYFKITLFKLETCFLEETNNQPKKQQLAVSPFFRDMRKHHIAEERKLLYFFHIYLFTAIGLLPGGSGYFTCKQNMKLVTTRFKSGGLHEEHVVATWNVGNHLSICL